MRIFSFLLFFMMYGATYAQDTGDSIFVEKNFWGYKYYQHNCRINFNQLPMVMANNFEAALLIGKARNRHTLSTILSGVGGFLVGLQLANAVIGGEANWTVGAVGGGLIVLSIPVNSSSGKFALKAVDVHNSQLMAQTSWKRQVFLGVSSYGAGFKYLF